MGKGDRPAMLGADGSAGAAQATGVAETAWCGVGARGRARRVGGAAVLAAVLIGGCTGGGGGGGDGRAAERSALPGRVCALLGDLEEVEAALSRRPEVFELDATALGDLLAERRQVLGELAERTDGELQNLLEDQVRSQEAFDEAWLDGWDQQRAELGRSHDDRWRNTVLGESVTRDDGEVIYTYDHGFFGAVAYERLVVGCRAPELAGGPTQETGEDPPAGRLVFLGPKNRHDFDEGGRLVSTDSSGDDERELMSPEPWTPLGSLEILPAGGSASSGGSGSPDSTGPTGSPDSPAGDRLLVGARRGDEFGTLIASPDGALVDVVVRAPGELTCTATDDTGDRLLGLENTALADERRLHLIELAGGGRSGPLDLPFAAVGCSDFVAGDRLVVGDAALDPDDDRGVWTVGLDGSEPRELHAVEGCTSDVSGVDPSGTRVLVAQSCLDPLMNGAWVVDLDTGDADHVVTGHVARPKWSPDGEWLVFGYSPLGEGLVPSIWQARADGRQLREVVDRIGYTPVWLPPAG